jgi:hypothetical protein
MKPQEMLESLTKQAEDIRQEIIQVEQSFTQKKEQFIRIQGAIEALQLVIQEEAAAPSVTPEVVAPETEPAS